MPVKDVIERARLSVHGTVQGVGFRPYVYRLATAARLSGFVRNGAEGVLIEVEGDSASIERFVGELTASPPPTAVIRHVKRVRSTPRGDGAFAIAESDRESKAGEVASFAGGVSPDVATCEACMRELFDPTDRRFRYPFISCVHCGPRWTIAEGFPFDRGRTTMASFEMCALCEREYNRPADRRFHAQTNCCPDCGPRLGFVRADSPATRVTGGDALAAAVAALRQGEIVAVKGLGGFHLACDAANSEAVHRLRQRKRREAKPFAVMVANAEAARRVGRVGDGLASVLGAQERPIVLIEKLRGSEVALEAVAPGNNRIGIFLPYTPLHHLLLADAGRPLVMTSGNLGGEPIVVDNDIALDRLGAIADSFLVNDRRIAIRCDDSVVGVRNPKQEVQAHGGHGIAFVRRARGYAPRQLALREGIPRPVVAVGGHLKNTFCIASGRSAFVSQHTGDLESPASRLALSESITTCTRMLGVRLKVVAHDIHPDYASTHAALALDVEQRVPVQHHHGHLLSCLAERGVTEPALGIVFDGSGLGDDGSIWGGELLFVDGPRFQRLGHLGQIVLPGGDAAARRPWRAAAAHLYHAFGEGTDSLTIPFFEHAAPGEWNLVKQMMEKRVSSPLTSSVGRLFDAVASIAGLRQTAQFEGQAAIELESIADRSTTRTYSVDAHVDGDRMVVNPRGLVSGVVTDIAGGRPVSEIAGAFHNAVRDAAVAMANHGRLATGCRRIALTGGVFQNALLEESLTGALEALDFEVLLHERVPCNDGGLSLGQAVAAARWLAAQGD